VSSAVGLTRTTFARPRPQNNNTVHFVLGMLRNIAISLSVCLSGSRVCLTDSRVPLPLMQWRQRLLTGRCGRNVIDTERARGPATKSAGNEKNSFSEWAELSLRMCELIDSLSWSAWRNPGCHKRYSTASRWCMHRTPIFHCIFSHK